MDARLQLTGGCDMHRLERPVVNAERQAFGEGCCPHRPPLVIHKHDWHKPARKAARETPCWCGRPRLTLVVEHVREWRALDVAEEPDTEA